MKRLFLTLAMSLGLLGVSWAQNMGGGTGQQLPVGQTFKNFNFPIYENGKLKARFIAAEAKAVTQNRAETTNLTIYVYDKDNPNPTTTITSPKADLYVNERKMRTKNTVLIVRQNQVISAQSCDFDLINNKYMLRTHVRVILKNVNVSASPTPAVSSAPVAPPPASPASATTPAPSAENLPEATMETPISTSPPIPTSHPTK